MNNKYYKENAQAFIESTENANMMQLYDFFEKHLKSEKNKILDLGFGSGRDTIYFAKKYEVVSIDPVDIFVENLRPKVSSEIYQMGVLEMNFNDEFDGIWACASLLHIPNNELPLAFKKCHSALKSNGVFYLSFKYGELEGVRNGRFFNDMTLEKFKKNLPDSLFKIEEIMITKDVRVERSDEWLNLILIKI